MRVLPGEKRSDDPTSGTDAGRGGAYGLAFEGMTPCDGWWVPAPAEWPSWRIEWHGPGAGERPVQELDGEHGRVWLRPSGYAEMERARARTALFLPDEPTPVGLVHPYSGSTAVVAAYWHGRESFHAGSFVKDGRVWAFVGDRDQGKSSALAWLLKNGFAIFGDDLLVLGTMTALAGPRSLDLRAKSSEWFGLGSDIGVLGSRRRWRVHLPPVPAELPFGGWVVLRWTSGEPKVRPAAAHERLPALIEAKGLRIAPTDTHAWLELSTMPMLVFERPRRWASMDPAMELLLRSL